MSEKFARGRTAEIIHLEDGKVLKLYFEEYPIDEVEREFKNAKIAFDCGCTPIRVYQRVDQDNRHGFTMDFAPGVSQNDMPTKNPLYIFRGGTDLARQHVLVHQKKSHELEDIRVRCCNLINGNDCFDNLSADEKEKATRYIMALPEEDTIIHLDFHTGNVLVDDDGTCRVIDWPTAARGNRAVEYAMMQFLFADAELFPEASELMIKIYGAIRGMIGRQYYKEYQKLYPLSADEVDRYRLLALIVRRSWNIAFEKDNLNRQIKENIDRLCK